MGRKTGLIIGLVLFLTIMATFLVMYMKGDLLMERISLGALIIALCMLTDNAIIVIEGIKVGIEAGEDKLAGGSRSGRAEPVAAVRGDGHRRHRLRRDRPVGGQHRRVLQLSVLGHLDLAEPELGVVDHRHAAAGLPVVQAECRRERRRAAIRTGAFSSGPTVDSGPRTALSLGGGGCCPLVLFVAALYGFTKVDAELFPAGDAAAIHGGRVSAGRHSYPRIGGVCRRRCSSTSRSSPASPTSRHSSAAAACASCSSTRRRARTAAFVQFLVDVDDPTKIDGLIADDPEVSGRRAYPNANAVAKKFLLGPGSGGRIQARFSGPDPAELRELADQAKQDLRRRRRGRVRAQRLAGTRKGGPP